MKRKLFLLLLSACMLLQSSLFTTAADNNESAETIPVQQFSDGTFGYNDTSMGLFCFRSLSDSTAEFLYWTAPGDPIPVPDRIVIPSEVDGKKVISIAKQDNGLPNFLYAPIADPNDEAAVQRIESLKKIGEIVVPEGITSIADGAFAYVLVNKVTLPSTLKTIGKNAFAGSHITSVNIPVGVTSIGENCFSNCDKLQSITLPYTLTSVGDYVCSQCDNLVSANVQCCYTSKQPKGMFSYCKNLKNITLAEDFTEIHEQMFQGCESLESIVIPQKVKSLGHSAFYDCKNLKDITFSGNVQVGIMSFFNCNSLESITVTGNIEPASFLGCSSLKTVKIGPDVDQIKMINVFTFAKELQSIEVDPNNKQYASYDGVLYNKSLTHLIYCPSGKTTIELPSSIKTVGYASFFGSNLGKEFFKSPILLSAVVLVGLLKY